MENVTNVSLRKKEQWEEEYRKYTKETGKIMHGASMKAIAADLAKHCTSKNDLYVLRRIYALKAAEKNLEGGIHGFNFYVQAFDDILNELL